MAGPENFCLARVTGDGVTRRLCGVRWPARLCAPGAEHQCVRPVVPLTDRLGHPGACCCKCGDWKPEDAGGE